MNETIRIDNASLSIDSDLVTLELRSDIDVERYFEYCFDGEKITGAKVFINVDKCDIHIYSGSKRKALEDIRLYGNARFEKLFDNPNLKVDIISIIGKKEKNPGDCLVRGQLLTDIEITANIQTEVIEPIPDPVIRVFAPH
ncbi:MAG TPA: hypothetical protein PKY97_00550 [Saprospiraceae bacterium]|nr:hypothetical protein [Saprospiraceae bacterium]HRG68423.1 hypothetical protein [Saprospiraceae bacterium]